MATLLLRGCEDRGQVLENVLHLHAGEIRAQAEVRSDPECHMRIRIAVEDELVSPLEDVFVAVRGLIEHQDPVAVDEIHVPEPHAAPR